MNKKRIQRLWRAEGLKVPYRKCKKSLRGLGVYTLAAINHFANLREVFDRRHITSAKLRTGLPTNLRISKVVIVGLNAIMRCSRGARATDAIS